MEEDNKKQHRVSKVGNKAAKKSAKKQEKRNPATVAEARERNPKAFAFQSTDKAIKKERRQIDNNVRRMRMPNSQRAATPSSAINIEKTPPVIISVVGPPKVGKTTVIQSLIKYYSRQSLVEPTGPITVVSGKNRRLTFFECKNDLNSMIDCAKISDLVLLIIDGSFGFEMETFEFLNICQVHGFPKVMGVLTHMDSIKSGKALRRTQTQLKHRFQQEVYPGAKLFHFSGIVNDQYPRQQIVNLGRFISVMKFRPLKWQNSHSYMLADRMEDITHPQKVEDDPSTDRKIVMYGYLRGTRLKSGTKVHIPGCDDFWLSDVTELADPCPLPDTSAIRRTLSEKQRQLYAPFSNVTNIALDKDATYIEIPDHKVVFTKRDGENIDDEAQLVIGEKMVRTMQSTEETIDEKLGDSKISLFSHSTPIASRERRPMVFAKPLEEEGQQDDESDDSDDEELFHKAMREEIDDMDDEISHGDASEDNIEDSSEGEEGGGLFGRKKSVEGSVDNQTWFDKVTSLYKGKGKNLMEIVYGERAVATDASDDEGNGELLRLVQDKHQQNFQDVDKLDSSRYQVGEEDWTAWDKDEDAMEKLKEKFSAVAWFEDVDDSLVNDSDDELYGDFEDLEAGEEGEEKADVSGEEEEGEDGDVDPMDAKMDRLKKKEALKAKFNSEYDDDEGDSSYLEQRKTEIERQEKLNEEEFAMDDPLLRAQILGYEAGSYIRIQLSGIPCEFVEKFNPHVPLVMGGLLPNEHSVGFVQTRLKRHRWHRKIMKTNDPLIVSMGWRRFQTLPLYSLADDAMKHRMLKYTPEHMHCYGTFYGPVTPPNTGFIAFQRLKNNVKSFRVAVTGVVLENDQKFEIVKKLKLTGNPFKTYKNTAFIRGMFTSELEVAKFQGAAIRTVSGVRGSIKKPLKTPGTFRATFEDKILMSDIVFLRTWYPVHPQKYYNPVTSLLDEEWNGMKTVFDIRQEKSIPIPLNQDSLYKPIEREARKFNKLKIPKAVERELPFAMKPKRLEKKEKLNRPRLVGYGSKEERNVNHLLQQLGTIKNDKIRKAKEKSEQNYIKRQKTLKAEREVLEAKAKVSRKRVFRLQGIEEERAKKKSKYGH